MNHPLLREKLQSVSVCDVMPKRDIVIAKARNTVHDTLQVMASQQILSVPVFDDETGRVIGMFDIQDALRLILKVANDSPSKMLEMNVAEAVNLSKFDVFLPIEESLSLYHLMEWFTRGVHRVPVIDQEGVVKNVVSQSSIIRYLADNIDLLDDDVRQSSAEEVKLYHKGVECYSGAVKCVEVFQIMSEKGRDEVPLTNEDGDLIGSFSLSTLRGMSSDLFKILNEPVMTLSKFNIETDVCSPHDKIGEIITKMSVNGKHVLWVVEGKKAIGILTLTDIIRFFMRHMTPRFSRKKIFTDSHNDTST